MRRVRVHLRVALSGVNTAYTSVQRCGNERPAVLPAIGRSRRRVVTVAQEMDAASGRLAHLAQDFGTTGQSQVVVAGAQPSTRRPALALTAEGPRRADLIAWAGVHQAALRTMRLLAPAGVGALLAEHVGLSAERLRPGTAGPAATAGLAAAGNIDAMIAFSDPIELRPGDTTTRSLTRLAVFWDIP